MGLIKSDAEIVSIEHSLQVTAGAFALVEQILKQSTVAGEVVLYKKEVLTSEYLHEIVTTYLSEHNFAMPEGLIISSGLDAAEPHHKGIGPIIPHTAIVVDIFPQDTKSGMYADITRSYVKGEVYKELQRQYDTVVAAHQAALKSIRPGIPAHEVYDVACQVIVDAGYDVSKTVGFVHSLGHGVGEAVHEAPRLGAGDETLLEAGMVVTIEPGLYYPDKGGIRVEDTILITDTGYRNLTNVPYTWHIP